MSDPTIIGPQPGPQEAFLSSSADIVIYGGSAGGGKSFGLLIEPMRHVNVKGFNAVLFRRTTVDLRNRGGLWSESQEMYSAAYGTPRESPLMEWRFRSGAVIQFAHLEHDKTVLSWQGAQVCLVGFDELTQFSEYQFWYMLSRNRSMCGVKPYVRCTTNPEADSWVGRLIAWWINQDTGYAIPERAGIVRYFVRVNDSLVWGDAPEDLLMYVDDRGDPIPPKSLTFIPASLEDNKKLMQADPGYRANLLALGTVERERLLKGNWKIRPSAGLYFQREWVEVVDKAPNILRRVRGWDLAATEERDGTDPDWTCGNLMGLDKETGRFWVLDHVYGRLSPHRVEKLLSDTARRDGKSVMIGIPQDPAQAGKAQKVALARLLSGYNVRFRPASGDKITRFSAFSAQAEAQNVSIVRGAWNDRWFRQLENFPPDDHGHDDDADATSEAFGTLMRYMSHTAMISAPEVIQLYA